MPFDSLPVTSPTLEMLRLGRALIEARGLARGIAQDGLGRFCTLGAITRGSCFSDVGVMDQAINYLARAIPAKRYAIGSWNDHSSRTQADVVAAYDRAIYLAEADALNAAQESDRE